MFVRQVVRKQNSFLLGGVNTAETARFSLIIHIILYKYHINHFLRSERVVQAIAVSPAPTLSRSLVADAQAWRSWMSS